VFHAARDAWNRAREKRLFGLVAFEFLAVVLGLLPALRFARRTALLAGALMVIVFSVVKPGR